MGNVCHVAANQIVSGILHLFEICAQCNPLRDANRGLAVEKPIVVIVLGGPGSGKGTQCARINQHFGFTHLSSGEILRNEARTNLIDGPMIQSMLNEGAIVPPEFVIKLIKKAMDDSGNNKFVFDGFPRCEETRMAFENATHIEPDLVLFFDCPDEVMENRLQSRNQRREDDTINTIRKRLCVHREKTLPVIQHYDSKGKVVKIDAARSVDDVFNDVKDIFSRNNDVLKVFNNDTRS